MSRLPRAELFDPDVVGIYHCIHRCVRRCFLHGVDPLTGKNYEHRKRWIHQRLEFLAGCFAIDCLGYAILSNHFHVVLRNRPDIVALWSDTEVARRWWQICPLRKNPDDSPAEPTVAELDLIRNDPQRLTEIRRRLSDISWLMRMVAERIARCSNAEDQCSGRFWEGRFRSVRLLDEAALLACSIYVDLNPIRACLAPTPEQCEYTSARERIDLWRARQSAGGQSSPAAVIDDSWLAPLTLDERSEAAGGALPSASGRRASDKGYLPLSLEEYLQLLDWTARQRKPGTGGATAAELPPILKRLAISAECWLQLTEQFGRLFGRVAGRRAAVAAARSCCRQRPFRSRRACPLQ